MKKFFLIAILAFLFVGCQQVTNELPQATDESTVIQTTDGVRYVKNSCWNSCSLSYLTAKASSRAAAAEISAADLENIVDTINEETNDDQLVVLPEDIPIEESPLVDVYIAKPVDGYYVILIQVLGMERSYYVQNKQYFEQDAINEGGVLFVDKVPETVPIVVPVVDTRTPYEKYAIYAVITETGKIYLEEHCQNEWDSVYSKETNCLYTSVEDYFNHRLAAFNQEAQWSGWTIYSGQIYTEPTE